MPLKSWGIRVQCGNLSACLPFLEAMSEWGDSKQAHWAGTGKFSTSGSPVSSTWTSPDGALKNPIAYATPHTNCIRIPGVFTVVYTVSSLGDFSVQLRLISPDHQLVRNVNFQTQPQTLHQKTLGLGLDICVWTSFATLGRDSLQVFLKPEVTSVIWQPRDADGWFFVFSVLSSVTPGCLCVCVCFIFTSGENKVIHIFTCIDYFC